MIDLTTINEWQRMSPDLEIPEPWYVFPALDEINTWDLSDKTVLEIGGGASTVWWNKKAKMVFTFEDNLEYGQCIAEEGCYVVKLEAFTRIFRVPIDIAIVDNDGERDEFIKHALKYLKPHGRLIVDNWMQGSVDWQPSQEIQDLLLSYDHKIFKQPGHPDWSTIIIYL